MIEGAPEITFKNRNFPKIQIFKIEIRQEKCVKKLSLVIDFKPKFMFFGSFLKT